MVQLCLRARSALPLSLVRPTRLLPSAYPRRSLLLRRPNSTSAAPSPAPASAASATTAATPSSSSSSSSSSNKSSEIFGVSAFRAALFATAFGASVFAVCLYVTDTRAAAHRWVVPRMMRVVCPDAEDAHSVGTWSMKLLYRVGLYPRDRTDRGSGASELAVSVFGEGDPAQAAALSNPIGISAGLDKDGEITDALFALGAAVVEIGGCTPRPQPGNPSPRMFRVPSLEGLVNRYGLNSIGADALAARLHARLRDFCRKHRLSEADVLSGAAGVPPGSLVPGRLLMVQVAKNKNTDEHDVAAVADDYTYCVRRLAPYADVVVVNVSSPNTPGLRDLQAVEPLTKILTAVVAESRRVVVSGTTNSQAPPRAHAPRVMVKVSPDEDEDAQIDGICDAVWASGVDGIIVGNTTKRRTGLVPPAVTLSPKEQSALAETGGFSGPAMFYRTLALVRRYRKRLDEQALRDSATTKTLFASGGVATGAHAQQLLNAGASVAMVYTSLVYGGAGTVTRIKQELKELIAQDKPALS